MDNSTDSRVQGFLDDLWEVEPDKHTIIQACRKLVFNVHPGVGERIMYGGVMFSLNGDDFGGLYVSKKHVSFEFGRGVELNDPNGILEGVGKFRRHIKLNSLDDIMQKTIAAFVQQIDLKN